MSFKPSLLIQNLAVTCKGDGQIRNDGQQIAWWNHIVDYFKGRSPRQHFADMLTELHLQDSRQTSIEILGRCIQISEQVTKKLKDVGEGPKSYRYNESEALRNIDRLKEAVYGSVNKDNVEEVVKPIFAKFTQAAKTQDRALLERGIRELRPLVEYHRALNVPVALEIRKLWENKSVNFIYKETPQSFLTRVYRYAISLFFKPSPVNVIESVEKVIGFPKSLTIDEFVPPPSVAPSKLSSPPPLTLGNRVLPPPPPAKARLRPLPEVSGRASETVCKNPSVKGLHHQPPLEGIRQLVAAVGKIQDNRHIISKALRAILWAQICAELFKVENSFLLTVASAFSVIDDKKDFAEDLLENFLDSVCSDDTLSIKYSKLLRKALDSTSKADDIEEAIISDALVVCGAQQAKNTDFDFLYFDKDKKNKSNSKDLKNLCKEMRNLGVVLNHNGLDAVYSDPDYYGNLITLVNRLHGKDITSFKTLISRLPEDVTPIPSDKNNTALEQAISLIALRIQSKAIKFE